MVRLLILIHKRFVFSLFAQKYYDIDKFETITRIFKFILFTLVCGSIYHFSNIIQEDVTS